MRRTTTDLAALLAALALLGGACGTQAATAPTGASADGPTALARYDFDGAPVDGWATAAATADPAPVEGSVPAWLEADGRFTSLTTLLKATDTTIRKAEGSTEFLTWWEIWQHGDHAALEERDADMTLFAPTDVAFAALGEGAVEALLDLPGDERYLLLGRHVTGFDFPSAKFVDREVSAWAQKYATQQVTMTADPPTWGGADIVEVDRRIGRFRIHVIDDVVLTEAADAATADLEPAWFRDPRLPAREDSMVGWMEADGRFDIMLAGLKAHPTTLRRDGLPGFYTGWEIHQVAPDPADAPPTRTQWLPTDEAMERAGLTAEVLRAMPDELAYLLGGMHWTRRTVRSEDFTTGHGPVWGGPSEAPGARRVFLDAEAMTFGGAPIIETDHLVHGWLTHVIDGVVIPDEVAAWLDARDAA